MEKKKILKELECIQNDFKQVQDDVIRTSLSMLVTANRIKKRLISQTTDDACLCNIINGIVDIIESVTTSCVYESAGFLSIDVQSSTEIN